MKENIFRTIWLIIICVTFFMVISRWSSCSEHNDEWRYNGDAPDKVKAKKK